MTITSDQILAIAGLIGALGVIYGVISKPVKAMKELTDSVEKLTESVADIKETVDMQGDMVYQLLEHASTNNNTGGMADALNRYNEFFRH